MRWLALLALAAIPHWTRTDLPVPAAHRGLFVVSVGVNGHGTALYEGTYGRPGAIHQLAFTWRNGKLTPLTYRTSHWIDVVAIDDAGDVAGEAEAPGGSVAIRWRNGKPTPIGDSRSSAIAMNAHGDIAGTENDVAVLWRGGTETRLGSAMRPVAINAHDEIVGDSITGHAFSWADGTITDLGADTEAAAVNDAGLIVGDRIAPSGQPIDAVEWRNGTMLDLGRFGAPDAQAIAVNARGDVLVETMTSGGDPVGIVLLRGEHAIHIPALGGPVTARGLDDRGNVLGFGLQPGHGRRSFVWADGRTTVLPTSDGASPPWGAPRAIDNGWAVGDEYVPLQGGDSTAHAVLWHQPAKTSR